MRGTDNLPPVDALKLHEGCHSVQVRIRVLLEKRAISTIRLPHKHVRLTVYTYIHVVFLHLTAARGTP